LRVEDSEDALVRAASEAKETSYSNFIRSAAVSEAQRVLAVVVLVPLLLIGVLPLLNGSVNYANFTDLVPPSNVYVTRPPGDTGPTGPVCLMDTSAW